MVSLVFQIIIKCVGCRAFIHEDLHEGGRITGWKLAFRGLYPSFICLFQSADRYPCANGIIQLNAKLLITTSEKLFFRLPCNKFV